MGKCVKTKGQPRPVKHCKRCGHTIGNEFEYCYKCYCKLNPWFAEDMKQRRLKEALAKFDNQSCLQCGKSIRNGKSYCKKCARYKR